MTGVQEPSMLETYVAMKDISMSICPHILYHVLISHTDRIIRCAISGNVSNHLTGPPPYSYNQDKMSSVADILLEKVPIGSQIIVLVQVLTDLLWFSFLPGISYMNSANVRRKVFLFICW